jgi:hypothetical protein|tara:strand:+ start:1656 stop:2354 length:699 start_codon:yes stop_codon:yes gene_type:complete
MLNIGSVVTDENGMSTIYVDYDNVTRKQICKIFGWKKLTSKRLTKLFMGTLEYKRNTDKNFSLGTETGLNSHLLITRHIAMDKVKAKRVVSYTPTSIDQKCILTAWDWMQNLYDKKLVTFPKMPPVKFSTALNRSEFSKQYGILISKGIDGTVREKFIWKIYDDNPMGLSSSNGIVCSEEEYTTLNLIHEFTHYLQAVTDKELEELEPTVNDLEYCETHYPHLFKQLEEIKI